MKQLTNYLKLNFLANNLLTKSTRIIMVVFLSSLFFGVGHVGANPSDVCKDLPSPEKGACLVDPEAWQEDKSGEGVYGLIGDIIDIFSIVVGVISVIMIIIGGLKYITSSGDSNNVTSAKNTILYAVIGLVVVAFAQIIVLFVLGAVDGDEE